MTTQEWAQEIVRGAPGRPVVLELGAHHGQDTTRIHDACRAAPVYIAVEADPRNLPVLRQTIGTRAVMVVHAAIADRCGEATFHQCEGNHDASGSIRTPKAHLVEFPHITFEHDVRVPATTLDALAERLGVGEVDLLWCDIQGAEGEMIVGGQRVLERTRWLVIEADRLEMYVGQMTRAMVESLLPGWEIIDEWPIDANVLFRNLSFERDL
jgi:FkbM family methyltransferase